MDEDGSRRRGLRVMRSTHVLNGTGDGTQRPLETEDAIEETSGGRKPGRAGLGGEVARP